MKKLTKFLQALALLAAASIANAQLAIEITGAGANRMPIAIADFAGDRIVSQALVSVVRADLERSGEFSLVPAGDQPLPENTAVNYADWKGRGADALTVGSVGVMADGRYEVRFRLYDTQKGAALGGMRYVTTGAGLRKAAHQLADFIYEKLTGARGIFSTQVAYVVKSGKSYELQIADADGQNPQSPLKSPEPIISPSWSPDGTQLAYVSFAAKKPVVEVFSLATGQRRVVANFKGSNSAPAWSPDGRRLAVVLSKDGGSQLFVIGADGSNAVRLMSSPAIDTEPQFSPDGKHIYFTSDRGGSPQIYRIPAMGGEVQRVTFEGAYNVTPRLSPDSRILAYVARQEGRFQVAAMDLSNRQVQILTDSAKDESPSFAPNGRMILFATEIGGRGILSAVSADGRVKQRLSVRAGDVREPAWGPFVK